MTMVSIIAINHHAGSLPSHLRFIRLIFRINGHERRITEDQLPLRRSLLFPSRPIARCKSLPITSSRARVAFRVDSRASARNYAKLRRREREKGKNGRITTILGSSTLGLKKATLDGISRIVP